MSKPEPDSIIPLGARARDIYTGFTGIVTAVTHWLYGCSRITLEPTDLDKEGKLRDSACFDAQRIEVLDEEAPRVVTNSGPGGPRPDPTRAPDPTR